jgi:hypothetical protein
MQKNNKIFEFTNQPKLLLTLDWLTLNVDDVFKGLILDENNQFIINDFVLQFIDGKRTAHFNKYFTLNYQGRFIGTITSSSNSPHILVNRAHIKFENFLFYENTIEEIAVKIVENFQIKFVSISRVDVACDGVYLHPFINNYLYSDDKKSIRSSIGRYCQHDNILPIFNSSEDIRTHNFSAYYIGQMGSKKANRSKSERYIRYYNKTLEIQQTQKKSYILDYYQNNDFDLNKDVFRFEVEFASSFLAKLKNFNWQHIFDHEKLVKLFQSGITNLFDFYYKVPDQPKKYSVKLEIFKGFAKSTYQRIKKIVTDKVRTIKIGVKRLVSELLIGTMSGEENFDIAINAKNIIKNYVDNFNLVQWFYNRYPHWQKEAKNQAIRENLKCPIYEPSIFLL